MIACGHATISAEMSPKEDIQVMKKKIRDFVDSFAGQAGSEKGN